MSILYLHQKDTLNDLDLSYSNSKHRKIRMLPSDVTTNAKPKLLRDMHNIPVPRQPKQSFRVGDIVHMAMTKYSSRKKYIGQWSKELFVVAEKHRTIPTTYMVKDMDGEPIDGTLYHHKL